jgi:ribosomal protein RSM22 (predicted rRNA methylase)
MNIPYGLAEAIERHTEGISRSQLSRDAEKISRRYREAVGTGETIVSTPGEVLAYSVARMPATYGAVLSALKYSLDTISSVPKTLLDVGAGTGAASWAACSLLELNDITCFEREENMCRLGANLMSDASGQLSRARWICGDIRKDRLPGKADLVIASYVHNELTEKERAESFIKLWESTEMLLLIVEPGTPAGYSVVMQARNMLLGKGANIAAPCPHGHVCPLEISDPYGCHFSCRIPRSRLHREIKGGEAPYEDEKFIYLAVSRTPAKPAPARVLRHPYVEKGKVTVELCTSNGLERTIIRKGDDSYRQAAKAKWGDAFTI